MSLKKLFFNKISYSIIAIAFVLVFVSTTRDERNFSISKGLSIYASLFRELNMFYVDDFEPTELVEKSIKNLLQELDPYTVYYSEENKDDLKLLTKGEYGGIGSVISKRDNKIIIRQVYKGTPSHKNDLIAGDELISINGKILKGKSLSEISELLKGKPNSKIELVIQRPGDKGVLRKKMHRANITIPCVPYYGMLENSIGYIHFSKFTDKSAREVRKALINLKADGAKKMIIDLRDNPGGLLDQAAVISNFFVPKGELIVSTKGRIEKMNYNITAKSNPIMPNIPLVVLIGRGSASASEILAGAVQDLDRGVVIGQRSFGKGLVQTTRNLAYNTKLKLTTAKYYTPSGRCVQALDYSHRNEDGSVGVVPDSLISEFKTKNGRIVFDGGGITPDIKVSRHTFAEISRQLVINNLIFDFITKYKQSHDITGAPEKFVISDSLYKDFKEYVKESGFQYNTASEEKLKKLEEVAKLENYYNLASKEFEAIKQKLSHSVDKDLDVFNQEIKTLIAYELLQRAYFSEGVIRYRTHKDVEIDSAINVLNNTERYNKILAK